VAVVSAVAATLMGLANATGRKPNDTLEAHRWAGIVTTVVAMIALFLVHRARAAEGRKVQIARGSLFLGMILVSITVIGEASSLRPGLLQRGSSGMAQVPEEESAPAPV
jgi:hypothetical protein